MRKLTTFASVAVALSVSNALQSDLTSDSATSGDGQKQLMHEAANFCKIDKSQPVGSTCQKTFHDINSINMRIRSDLDKLVKTDFFKFFKLDLYGQCPFWKDNGGHCVNRACAVDVVEDWDNVPAMWQPEALGGLEGGKVHQNEESDDECKFLAELCDNNPKFSREVPDVDYCDVSDFTKKSSVLVDLTANPERFTGYGGQESAQIWSAIYKENCFTPGDKGLPLAKDVFYRLISGLHASIGTHLSNDFLNTTTGKWGPNLELFMARVGNFPDRIANIYFDFAIVAKALWKIKPYLEHIEFCNSQDADVKDTIDRMVSQLDNNIFNEDLLFRDDLSSTMKNDFRIRFKNVTKIMDCVHCDRCRMWGKVQTTGYATSLKILFEIDLQNEDVRQHIVDHLTKYELIALFNTFDRISKSVEAITNFERLYYKKLGENQGRFASFFKDNNFFKLLCKARSSFTQSTPTAAGEELIGGEGKAVLDSSKPEPKFTDLVMPAKPKRTRSASAKRSNLQVAWDTEIGNVRDALHKIWRSYITFPRNVCKVTIFYLNRWFNKFIGVAHYLRDDEEFLIE